MVVNEESTTMKAGCHRQKQMHLISSSTFFNLNINRNKDRSKFESVFSSSSDKGEYNLSKTHLCSTKANKYGKVRRRTIWSFLTSLLPYIHYFSTSKCLLKLHDPNYIKPFLSCIHRSV